MDGEEELRNDDEDGRDGLRVLSVYLNDERGQPDVAVLLESLGEVGRRASLHFLLHLSAVVVLPSFFLRASCCWF